MLGGQKGGFVQTTPVMGLRLSQVRPLCPTRWKVRTAAIDAVLRNYPALLEALVVDHMMIMVEGLMVFLHSLSVLIPTLDRNFLT